MMNNDLILVAYRVEERREEIRSMVLKFPKPISSGGDIDDIADMIDKLIGNWHVANVISFQRLESPNLP